MMEHYKGIMLCNRPQASINLDYHKPFVSRVNHIEPLGYNPVKQLQIHQPSKSYKPVLSQHKEWLKNFAKHAKDKKTALHHSQVQSKLHHDRYNSENQQQQQSNFETNKQDQIIEQRNEENKEETVNDQEVDELLSFTNNLDFDQYINDLEFKTVLEALKKRIEEIRIENPQLTQKDAVKKAVKQNTTQKSTKKTVQIQEELKDVKEEEINIENITKKLAEEILAKNKYLRNIHSTLSMQKLVETEARRFLQK